MAKGGYTYILTNYQRTVLYIGVTACLEKRMFEHKNKVSPGFTAQYKTDNLVYYEHYDRIEKAILREKQLKGKSRAKKEELIKAQNPQWDDLSIESN